MPSRSRNTRFCRAHIAVSFFHYGQQAGATASGNEPHVPLSPYFARRGRIGVDRLPLKKKAAPMSATARLLPGVQLSQIYRNEGSRPINATYIFQGSTRAAVNGMTMTISERRINGKIKEKGEEGVQCCQTGW